MIQDKIKNIKAENRLGNDMGISKNKL